MCEEELIRRSQTGDWSAFELLVERYRTVLTRTAYLMTRDRESVEDVMQEALVQEWRDLPSFRPIGSFKSWMMKILVNKIRKHYRRKRVSTVALESATEVPENSEGLDETIERREEARLLRQALELLSRDHREALVLRYFNELTVPEIAQTLGCREGTVKSRLSRALSRLQRALSDLEAHAKGGVKDDA